MHDTPPRKWAVIGPLSQKGKKQVARDRVETDARATTVRRPVASINPGQRLVISPYAGIRTQRGDAGEQLKRPTGALSQDRKIRSATRRGWLGGDSADHEDTSAIVVQRNAVAR